MATISAVGRFPSPAASSARMSEESRAFFQRRVAIFGLFGAALGGFFLVLRFAIAVVTQAPTNAAEGLSLIAHGGGVAFLGLAWVLCRGGERSAGFVSLVESTCLVASCLSYQAMGAAMGAADRPDMVVHAAMTFGLTARAIYVPSSARRSTGLGVVIGIGYVAMVYYTSGTVTDSSLALLRVDYPDITRAFFQRLAMVFAVAWWSGTVVITAAASRVIYGLRREVSHIKRLGQYTLHEKLGEGGMGVVHRASHAMLQRPTAVKLLPPDKVGEQSLERFAREVQLTAKLTHPHTITIYDYGRTPGGVFYYAMELLDGADLEEVVEAGGPMPAARAIHVLEQVLGALSEAHGVGLIHRDIKPQNIMLCERGGIPDFVKVLDFGLVKEARSQDSVTLTGTNVITGTPHFMSPEAIKNPSEVDARSDLYSLGVVAYFLVTGEFPFEGSGVVEICSHHLHTAPQPPSERNPAVPQALERLILACLAKKPEDRPASCTALVQSLRRCTDHGAWSKDDARAWWSEHGDSVRSTKQHAA